MPHTIFSGIGRAVHAMYVRLQPPNKGGLMSRRVDLMGKKFGAWNVIEYLGMNKRFQPIWFCRCDCGTERQVVGQTLRNGKSKSCGCKKPDAISKAQWFHGHSGSSRNGRKESPTYSTWRAMLRRCNPENKWTYRWYGSRGVTVCKRWHFFHNFLSDMGEKPQGMSLDRINVDGNYEPSNCRWADWKTQRSNQRRSK